MVAVNTLSLLAVLPALAMAAAVPGEGSHHVARHGAHGRHAGMAARAVGSGAQHRHRARGQPQCRPRPAVTSDDANPPPAPTADEAPAPAPTADDAHAPAPTADEAPAPVPTADEAPPTDGENKDDAPAPTHSEAAPAPPADDNNQSTGEGQAAPEEPKPEEQTEEQKGPTGLSNAWAQTASGNTGLLHASGPCGDNQADAENPNGQQWWFNCGINEGGWNPPFLTMDQVKYVDYKTNSFFEPCKDYFHVFEAASAQYGVPATFIAAIAMQESTCRPWLTGGAGEQGMMQLVGVNCNGAPNNAEGCKDVWFNVHSGTRYLREMTDQHGGSLLLGLGAYNGWQNGMTREDVRTKSREWGCYAQQNLDYMQEFLNGWLQGKEGWKLGTIKNRLECQ